MSDLQYLSLLKKPDVMSKLGVSGHRSVHAPWRMFIGLNARKEQAKPLVSLPGTDVRVNEKERDRPVRATL
jgi:hypothetical protein